MDDAESTSLWDELGVSADELTPPMPEHLWDAAIAAAIDPDTPPLDSGLVPYSDDATTGADSVAGDLGFPDTDVPGGSHDSGGPFDDAGSFDDDGVDPDDSDGGWGDAQVDDIDLGTDGF